MRVTASNALPPLPAHALNGLPASEGGAAAGGGGRGGDGEPSPPAAGSGAGGGSSGGHGAAASRQRGLSSPRTAGLPAELQTLARGKRELDDKLRKVETQIFDLEASYLEETWPHGNVVKGWDGFVKREKKSSGEDGGAPAASSQRYRKLRESDKVFSRSSTTAPSKGSAAAAAAAAASAAGRQAGAEASNDHGAGAGHGGDNDGDGSGGNKRRRKSSSSTQARRNRKR